MSVRYLFVLLLFCPTMVRAQLPVIVEHADAGTGQQLGLSVADLGDIDGDGLSDFACGVGEPGMIFVAPPGRGEVRIYVDGGETLLRTIDGQIVGGGFGFAVTGLGDVTGDGVPDLAVGAPQEAGSGRVHIHSGSNGSLHQTLTGSFPFGFFGAALARLPDVDGDGVGELIVGAPGHLAGAGRVAVFSGATGTLVFDCIGQIGENLGQSVAAAGDHDGDGFIDVLVGVPGVCEVRVFSGVDGSELTTFAGGAGADDFGMSVSGLGDLDGDGVPEYVVGAPSASSGALASGEVLVLSGAGGAELFSFHGDLGGHGLGHAVSGGLDLDGDGVGDIVATAPSADVGSSGTGLVRAFSGADGAVLLSHIGQSGTGLGASVAMMSDCNGDGLPDIVSGAPNGLFGGTVILMTVVGSRRYGTDVRGAQSLDLDWASPDGSDVGLLQVVGAGPFAFGALVASPRSASFTTGPGHDVHVDPVDARFVVFLYDMFGTLTLPISVTDAAFNGELLFLQAFAEDATGIMTSNGLELLFR